MDYVWELIAPWLVGLGGVTGCGAIIFAIARLLVVRAINKNGVMLENKFDTGKIAQGVADKLAGKTLNIDVTAVTEKALKKTATLLGERVGRVEEITASFKLILIAIAKAVVHFKALSEDERTELTVAIEQLIGEQLKPKEDEIMTVMLEPVALPGETEVEETEIKEENSAGVNFGDLEG